jgi:hypothetical protein
VIVLSLYDLTGIMGKPWAEAGHEVICVDLQHPKDGRYENGISFIHLDLSWDSEAWKLLAESLMGKEVFVIGFPPCTNLAASGSRHWQEKREADPEFQHKAAAGASPTTPSLHAISEVTFHQTINILFTPTSSLLATRTRRRLACGQEVGSSFLSFVASSRNIIYIVMRTGGC